MYRMSVILLAGCLGSAVTLQAAPPKEYDRKQIPPAKVTTKTVDVKKKSSARASSSTKPGDVEVSIIGGPRVSVTPETALGDQGLDLGGGPGPGLAETIRILSFKINNGQSTTPTRSVTLNIDATNNPMHYRVSESSYLAGVAWQSFTPQQPSFLLSPGQGTKTVYLELMGPSVPSPNVQGVMLANRATANDQIQWEIPDVVYHGSLVYRHHILKTELARGEATLVLPGYPFEDWGDGTLIAEHSYIIMSNSSPQPCIIPFTKGVVGFQSQFTTNWTTFSASTHAIKWHSQPGNQVVLDGIPGQDKLKVSTPRHMRFTYQRMMPTQTGSHTSLCVPNGGAPPPPQSILEAASPPELVNLEWHLVRQD